MTSRTTILILIAAVMASVATRAWGWQPGGSPPMIVGPQNSPYFTSDATDFDSGQSFPGDAPVFGDVYDPTAEGHWWLPQSFTGQLIWLGRTRSSEETQLLSRGELNPVTLAIDHSPAVYSSDLSFPVKLGVRGSVLFGKVDGVQAEIAYLGVFDQESSVRFSEPVDEVGIRFFDAVFVTTDTDITENYESDLHTAECNLWCEDGWRVQGMIGARWFQQSEVLEQVETFTVDDRAVTELQNDLVGGQLGFRTQFFQLGRFSVVTIAKGGVYSNDVRLAANVQAGGVTLATIAQTDRTTSYAGELNVSAVWQWTPYCNLHFGYTGLWLTQVATIGDQWDGFSTATGTGNFDYDSISYQGGHFGLSLAW